MNKQVVLIVFYLIISVLNLNANDGVYYMSGNQLVPLMESDIRVTKEILTISLCDDGMADVDVYYEFSNPGAEKTILVGFEADAPYNANFPFQTTGIHPCIEKFKVDMNNQSLPYSNAICRQGTTTGESLNLSVWKQSKDNPDALCNAKADSFISFSYVYKFKATFVPGINIVHHTYRYKMSGTIAVTYSIPYKLSPALRWANHEIEDFTLRIQAKNTAKHFCFESKVFEQSSFNVVEGQGKIRTIRKHNYDTPKDDIPIIEVSLRNGTVEWHSTHFKPSNELNINSADALSYDNKFVLGEFYDHSNNFDVRNLFACKYRNNAPLDMHVLYALPFAHRGESFNSNKKLKEYFSKLWWYMPDSTFSSKSVRLSLIETDYRSTALEALGQKAEVVVNTQTNKVVGRWLRTNKQTYSIVAQDFVEIPKQNHKVVLYKASDGQGVIMPKRKSISVRQSPSESAPVLATITSEEGYMPETLRCAGYANGWFIVNYKKRIGYVSVKQATWKAFF